MPPLPVLSLFLTVGFQKLVILTTMIRQPAVPCAVRMVVLLPDSACARGRIRRGHPAGAASPGSPAAWRSSRPPAAQRNKNSIVSWRLHLGRKKLRAQLRGTSVCAELDRGLCGGSGRARRSVSRARRDFPSLCTAVHRFPQVCIAILIDAKIRSDYLAVRLNREAKNFTDQLRRRRSFTATAPRD